MHGDVALRQNSRPALDLITPEANAFLTEFPIEKTIQSSSK